MLKNLSTNILPGISFYWSPSKVEESDLEGLGSCLDRYFIWKDKF